MSRIIADSAPICKLFAAIAGRVLRTQLTRVVWALLWSHAAKESHCQHSLRQCQLCSQAPSPLPRLRKVVVPQPQLVRLPPIIRASQTVRLPASLSVPCLDSCSSLPCSSCAVFSCAGEEIAARRVAFSINPHHKDVANP